MINLLRVVGIDVLLTTLEELEYNDEDILKYVIESSTFPCENLLDFDQCKLEKLRTGNFKCKIYTMNFNYFKKSHLKVILSVIILKIVNLINIKDYKNVM